MKFCQYSQIRLIWSLELCTLCFDPCLFDVDFSESKQSTKHKALSSKSV